MLQASKDSISNQLKSLELDKISMDNNKRPLFLSLSFQFESLYLCNSYSCSKTTLNKLKVKTNTSVNKKQ